MGIMFRIITLVRRSTFAITDIEKPIEMDGAWEVFFPLQRGAPPHFVAGIDIVTFSFRCELFFRHFRLQRNWCTNAGF